MQEGVQISASPGSFPSPGPTPGPAPAPSSSALAPCSGRGPGPGPVPAPAPTPPRPELAAGSPAAGQGGGVHRGLLAWVNSQAPELYREDLPLEELIRLLNLPADAQLAAVGYLRGYVQKGLLKNTSGESGFRLVGSVLNKSGRQASKSSAVQQLIELLSSPEPAHVSQWHKLDLGEPAMAAFLDCPIHVQHMVVQVCVPLESP